MSKPEVWFAIPSASPERCRKTLPEWRKRGYKIAVLQNVEKGDIPADIVEWSDSYPGWAESINILCRSIVPRSAQIVVSGGCDMLPDPNHTAEQLAEQFLERFPDTFGVMQPHGDEYMSARHYCGSPFLGRAWIDSMYGGTGPMHGKYRHNWADCELYWVSKCMGALWERSDLTHFHAHFRREGELQQPEWWTRNVGRHDKHDVTLYISRSWARFPGHEPKHPTIAGKSRTFDPAPLANDTVRFAEKHYQSRYDDQLLEDRTLRALDRCKKARLDRVAIYGAGSQTRRIAGVLADPGVEIACVIDDDTRRHGSTLWGFPIVSRERATQMGIEAVLISSDAFEGKMWDNCRMFADRRISVFRIHGPSSDEQLERMTRALAGLHARGKQRVGIYGDVERAQCLAACFKSSPVEIVCVIDEDPQRGASAIEGIPILSLFDAQSVALDAVVLSSSDYEPKRIEQAALFGDRGVEVVSPYQLGCKTLSHSAVGVAPSREPSHAA